MGSTQSLDGVYQILCPLVNKFLYAVLSFLFLFFLNQVLMFCREEQCGLTNKPCRWNYSCDNTSLLFAFFFIHIYNSKQNKDKNKTRPSAQTLEPQKVRPTCEERTRALFCPPRRRTYSYTSPSHRTVVRRRSRTPLLCRPRTHTEKKKSPESGLFFKYANGPH